MATKNLDTPKFMYYKGKPLVRCKDTIYYGDMSDAYVVKLQIKEKKEFKDMEIASSISIQLLSTDPNLNARKRIVKISKKESFYLAMDIAEIWLLRALNETIKA